MGQKEIARIAKRFHRKMQKIVDDSADITKITLRLEGEPPIVIAQKKQKTKALKAKKGE